MGVRPDDICHVGDSLEGDFIAARAVGMQAVLLQRQLGETALGVETIRSLAELPALWARLQGRPTRVCT